MPQIFLSRTTPSVGPAGLVARKPISPAGPPPSIESVFSIDVEDWFHILQVPGAPQIMNWDTLPSCVERNFMRILDLLEENGARSTCFFLGWVAQRYPHLVRAAALRGHEIASHGFAHRLVFQMTARRFRQDSIDARRVLEDIAGCKVLGYRAAGFSVIDKTPWFFDTLVEAGYEYDSSVFPATRGHGGMRNALREPHRIGCKAGSLVEFPITVSNAGPRAICFFGGGYLRVFPLWLIRRMARKVQAEGRPVIYYVHPREVDPHHPRLKMPLHRQFKSYVNLRTTERKIKRIVSEFPMVTFREFIERHGDSLEQRYV